MNFSYCSAFHNGTRKERYGFSKGRLSLAEPPLFLNSPQDCLEIHLLQSARCRGFRRAAVAFASDRRRRGFHPRPDKPFEKGLTENFSFLDKDFKIRGVSRSLTLNYSLFVIHHT